MRTRRVWVAAAGAVLAGAALACNFGQAAPTATLPPAVCCAPATDEATPVVAEPSATRAEATSTRPPATATEAADAASATPAVEASATAAAVPERPLDSSGPWLVAWGETGAYAVNADGSGLTQVLADWPYLAPGPAAPSGGLVAFVGSEDARGERGLTLYTLEVGTGTVTEVARLANEQTEPGPSTGPGDPVYQIGWVLGQSAWSPAGAPGGPRLAFIGAQDGPSADLYVYSPADGSVTRLTDGPSQAYEPHWSPDGQYIVQMGADSFGSGAGYAMAGVWAARADNTQVLPLYTPDSGDEIVVGWTGPTTFVVESFYARCSVGQLRAFDIGSGQATPLFAGYYNGAALDPESGAALVAVGEFVAECNAFEEQAGPEPGVYLARAGAEPVRVSEVEADAVTWLAGARLFLARLGESVQAFTAEGQEATLPEGMTAYWDVATRAREGGVDWAWPAPGGGGLWVSVGGEAARAISEEGAYFPTWSPNGHTLLFYEGDALRAAELPGLAPAVVSEAGQLEGKLNPPTWVP